MYQTTNNRVRSRAFSRMLERQSEVHHQEWLNMNIQTENQWSGGKLALMTCGDNCAGMNAGIRTVVNVARHMGAWVTYIKCGVHGLVEGGDYFETASMYGNLDIITHGGTILKSLKCPAFNQRATRLTAAKNLVEKDISYLLVMGGDGSMSAMKLLWEEWKGLLKELGDKDMVSPELIERNKYLSVGVIACSITNDVCGTDSCVGADTALHRIIEVTDSLGTTASSAKVAFVLELIGDTCGYLTLTAGLATAATMVFIPEWPSQGDWRKELNLKVKEAMEKEIQIIMVLVATGAADKNGQPIKMKDISDVLINDHGLDTECSVLGHVQKGGSPSSYDRLLAARLSAESVMAVHYRDETDGPFVMGIEGNEVRCLSLVDTVKKNNEILQAISDRDFAKAVRYRGRKFQSYLNAYKMLNRLQPSPMLRMYESNYVRKVAVIRVGRYSVGHCLVARAIVGFCASKGVAVYGILKGFEGLIPPRQVQHLTWEHVRNWDSKTVGCFGSSRSTPSDIGMDIVAAAFEELNLGGLILIGSFSAFEALYQMYMASSQYKALAIPMCVLPVTIINNVPGTEISIGCDSALNETVAYCDKMKRMAKSFDATVIVVETIGANCGYLTTVGHVCAGADVSYIRNEKFNIDTLLTDVATIKSKIHEHGMRIGLVLHAENASANYNSQFTHQLFAEEGRDVFHCRHETIGHVQVGVEPSPRDRIDATVQGLLCGEFLLEKIHDSICPDGSIHCTDPRGMSVLCTTRCIEFKPVMELAVETDFEEKLPTNLWWQKLRKLGRILSKLPTETYEMEMVEEGFYSLTKDDPRDIFSMELSQMEGKQGTL